jgi:hypothetical protein
MRIAAIAALLLLAAALPAAAHCTYPEPGSQKTVQAPPAPPAPTPTSPAPEPRRNG